VHMLQKNHQFEKNLVQVRTTSSIPGISPDSEFNPILKYSSSCFLYTGHFVRALVYERFEIFL
jgi:hypothetical protein